MIVLRWLLWRWFGAYSVTSATLDAIDASVSEQAQEMGL